MTGNEYSDVRFEILEEIGILSTAGTGWAKELNLVSWNGAPARYDIREWDPLHTRMSRGITLEELEMRRVVDLLRRRRVNAQRNQAFGGARTTERKNFDNVGDDSADTELAEKAETAEGNPMEDLIREETTDDEISDESAGLETDDQAADSDETASEGFAS